MTATPFRKGDNEKIKIDSYNTKFDFILVLLH